jgi:PAS domain S-box-containing protein
MHNKTLLSNIINIAHDAIITTDDSQHIILFNHSAERIFGYTTAEVIGKPLDILLPSSFVDIHHQHLINFQNTKQTLKTRQMNERLELFGRRKDGTIFPCEASISKNTYKGQQFFTAMLRDITDRKKADEAIIASETRYRRLFETAKDGILILDAQSGKIVDVNPFLISLLGYTKEQFIEKEIWEIGFFKDIVANQDKFLELQQNEYVRYENLPLETAEGRKINVEFVSNVYLVDNQKVIQCNIRDITARKLAELKVHKLQRVHNVLSHINKEIVRVRNIDELFEKACNIAVEDGKFMMSWIGKMNTVTNEVEILHSAGFTGDYLDKLNIDLTDETPNDGPTKKAIKSGDHCILNDIENDLSIAPWRENALRHGFRSTVALVLKLSGKIYGTLNLYSNEVGFFDESELEILDEVAGDISFSLEFMLTEAKRNQAENSLISSETRYRRLFESAKDGILILDAETGMIVDVNPFLINLLGYTKEQFIEKEIWEIGFFKDILANHDKFLELQQKEYVRYENLPLETTDGRKINVEFVSNVYNVDNHKVIQCNIRDITKRKQAEKLLQENNTRLELAMNVGNMAWWEIDIKTGNIIYEKTKAEMLGFPIDKFHHYKDFIALIHPEDRAMVMNTIRDHVNRKTNKHEIEYRILTKSGVFIWLYDIGSVTSFDPDGNPLNVTGLVVNISKHKLAEQELIISKEKAEESDRLKTAFLQNMSHEIRTPLNGIIGFTELLTNEGLSKKEIKEYSGIISQSGNRLLEIVNNVLDISKIQTGQIKFEQKIIVLHDIFSGLQTFFTPIAKAKNISLKYHNQDDIYSTIYTDDAKLYQILTNLINNALKFTKSGNVDFGFETKDGFVQFYVIDTGIGFSEELYEKIFLRFIQAEQTMTKNYEGAGLGLAISKGMVELLGGKIWVESEVGKGTTFFFTLPIIPEVFEPKPESKKTEIPTKQTHGKILIAEDDPISFMYLSKILSKPGITIIHAENGKEAFEIVEKTPDINLILMDIRMPVMDGIEAVKLIKQIRPDLPVIAQTAYAFSEERKHILSIGFDEYLTKPMRSSQLKKIVLKYLN